MNEQTLTFTVYRLERSYVGAGLYEVDVHAHGGRGTELTYRCDPRIQPRVGQDLRVTIEQLPNGVTR